MPKFQFLNYDVYKNFLRSFSIQISRIIPTYVYYIRNLDRKAIRDPTIVSEIMRAMRKNQAGGLRRTSYLPLQVFIKKIWERFEHLFVCKPLSLLIILLSSRSVILAVEVDFDYAFVGTSPISVLEALYRSYSGARVLLIEAGATMGGAWKAIDICGVSNVDMGCHQIGADSRLRKFLEEYVGCHFVLMNNPYGNQMLQSSDSGLYFSQGCHELMSQLHRLVKASSIELLLGQKLQTIYLDFDRSIAEIKTDNKRYTVSKLVVSPCSYIEIENFPNLPKPRLSKHYHLYLLINDNTSVRFTYQHGFCKGISRAINLTPFSLELQGKGYQLIALQINDGSMLDQASFFLEELKKKQLIDSASMLINAETYIYEQAHFDKAALQKSHPQTASFFEILGTEAIWNISTNIDKWKKVLKPYNVILPNQE